MILFSFPRACFILALCVLPVLLIGQTAGMPDLNFGQAGQALIEDPVNTYYGGPMVLLPDGKLIVMGYEYDQNGENPVLVLTRFLPDGTPDPAYGINGQARPDINTGFDGGINKIALTADGKLIAAGVILTDTSSAAFVACVDANGELDPGFGQNGTVTFDIGSEDDDFWSILIKPDGKILLGGDTFDANNPGFFDLLLVQLLPDGSPDTAFGFGGIATADFASGLESILSLSLQADGKILAVGGNAVNDYDMEVARFFPDGSIDNTFANNGALIFGVPGRNDVAYAGAIQNDQKIVFCGTSFQDGTPTGETTLFRLNPDGSFDSGFGTGGKVFTDLGALDFARALVLQPDGKILVGAESVTSISNFNGSLWVLRYNTDGSLDNTFGTAGKAQTPLYADIAESAELLLQPDGKVVQSGTAEGKIILWRYLNDVMVAVEETVKSNIRLQIAPNPVVENAHLTWVQEKAGEVSGELYDAKGHMLQTVFPTSVFPAGLQEQEIQFGRETRAGIYFLVLKLGGIQQVLQVVKL